MLTAKVFIAGLLVNVYADNQKSDDRDGRHHSLSEIPFTSLLTGALVRPGDTSIPSSFSRPLANQDIRLNDGTGLYQVDTSGLSYIDEFGRKVEKRIYADRYIHGYQKGLIDTINALLSSYGLKATADSVGVNNLIRPDITFRQQTIPAVAVIPEVVPEKRLRLGQGYFKSIGRDAELVCEFPRDVDIVSNVVWQKVDSRGFYEEDITLAGDGRRGRFEIRQYSSGSSLFVRDFGTRDEGIYRCITSERLFVSGRPAPRTRVVYQEIDFYPRQYDGNGLRVDETTHRTTITNHPEGIRETNKLTRDK